MSILKLVRCPACGKTRLLRQQCPCGGRSRTTREPSTTRHVMIGLAWLLGFTMVLLAIAGSIAIMASPKWASGVLLGLVVTAALIQRGYDFEDGVDVHHTMLPAPFSWLTKVEMFFNFWQQDRPLWRCYRMATLLAIVAWIFLARLFPS